MDRSSGITTPGTEWRVKILRDAHTFAHIEVKKPNHVLCKRILRQWTAVRVPSSQALPQYSEAGTLVRSLISHEPSFTKPLNTGKNTQME